MVLKAKELRVLQKDELEGQLLELKQLLSKERATIAGGTRAENPGKIRRIRRDIARILTVLASKKKEATTKVAKPVAAKKKSEGKKGE